MITIGTATFPLILQGHTQIKDFSSGKTNIQYSLAPALIPDLDLEIDTLPPYQLLGLIPHHNIRFEDAVPSIVSADGGRRRRRESYLEQQCK